MIKNYMRKDLQAFSPYVSEPNIYPIKLDANENNLGHDERFIEQLKEIITNESLSRYINMDESPLLDELAAFYGLKKENIACGVGSDQLIDIFARVFLEPGDKVLIPSPSFSMFKQSIVINHGIAIEYELSTDYVYDIDEIITVYREVKPKYIILCSPNNPTGGAIPLEDIKKLLANVACPVILDEAYGEFNGESEVSLIHDYEHLIIFKTFSKLYGLAGLRLGYGLASKQLIDCLKIGIPPYNLSSFSLEAGRIALKYNAYFKEQLNIIVKERVRLEQELAYCTVVERIYPSSTNFLLIKLHSPDEVVRTLKVAGISVRDFTKHPQLLGCIRITVGTSYENDCVIDVLKGIRI